MTVGHKGGRTSEGGEGKGVWSVNMGRGEGVEPVTVGG